MENLYRFDPEHYIQNPKNLMASAQKLSRSNGSSTVCTLILDDKKFLRTALVGDSRYVIYSIRDLTF